MKNDFLTKVFRWFGVGLLITFLVGYLVSTNISLLTFLFSGSIYWIIFILEIVLAIVLSVRIRSMNSGVTKGLYVGYCALTGLTFSSIFVVYEISSIIWIFLASSIVFLLFSIIGKNTKINLSSFGIYFLIGLLGIIILSVINIFLMNQMLDMGLCIFSLIIFMGYVSYDVQKIVRNYDDSDNMAVIGAFDLYLDFINIFLRLLQLFGKNKD